jgi:uncharacterized membrane protein
VTSKNNTGCTLINRFSLSGRIVMRTLWTAFTVIGTYGIYVQSPLWAAIYIVLVLLGFILVVLPSLCTHCPYPSKHNTCLFMPPGLVTHFYPYKGPDMSTAGKICSLFAIAGMVIMPNIWLVSTPPLLLFFWLVALPTVAVFPLYYCTRCRHLDCPMNKAKIPNSSDIGH